jgi:dTMP kinase
MSSSETLFTERIKQELSLIKQSPSHDIKHGDLVIDFANQLHGLYGGDIDIISAAALLHDLGRVDAQLSEEECIAKTIELARELLVKLDFPSDKIVNVLQAIEDHDKSIFKPRTLEGRILKDADFLAGFSAWGILRIAMWAGETRGGVEQFIDAVDNHMPLRVNNLEFAESQLYAKKEFAFATFFEETLLHRPSLKSPYPGKYVLIEGNSGVGKDTQAKWLQKKLNAAGIKNIIVHEPSHTFRQISKFWERSNGSELKDKGSYFRRYLILADRAKQIQEVVIPALKEGTFVISVRSFISMLVYQCDNQLDRSLITYLHQFVPLPDLVVMYDTTEEICFERINKRHRKIQLFDRLEELRKYRGIFLKAANYNYIGCPVEVINASGKRRDVSLETWKMIQKYIQT